MNKLQTNTKIIIALIALLVLQFFWNDWKSHKADNEARELRNQVVAKDSVIKERDSSFTRLSYEYTSQKDMNAKLKGMNADLAKLVKEKDEKIAYLISVGVKVETVFVQKTNTYIKDSVAYFKGYQKPYTVSGEVHLKDTTTKKLNVKMDDFKLIIVESKTDDGFYRARLKFVDLSGNALTMFNPVDIESAINTDLNNKVHFMNIGLGGEISLNSLSVGGLLNLYDKNIFIVNYSLFNEKLSGGSWLNRISVGYYRILF